VKAAVAVVVGGQIQKKKRSPSGREPILLLHRDGKKEEKRRTRGNCASCNTTSPRTVKSLRKGGDRTRLVVLQLAQLAKRR